MKVFYESAIEIFFNYAREFQLRYSNEFCIEFVASLVRPCYIIYSVYFWINL